MCHFNTSIFITFINIKMDVTLNIMRSALKNSFFTYVYINLSQNINIASERITCVYIVKKQKFFLLSGTNFMGVDMEVKKLTYKLYGVM